MTSCWNVWKLYLSSNIFVSRLRLASFDSRGKLVCSRSTGYQLLTLEKDQVSEYSPFLKGNCKLGNMLQFLQSYRSMWWWIWTAGCYHSPSTCAVTSCIHHLSQITVQTPQTKTGLLTVCLDTCSPAISCCHSSVTAETLDTSLYVQSMASFNTFWHWTYRLHAL